MKGSMQSLWKSEQKVNSSIWLKARKVQTRSIPSWLFVAEAESQLKLKREDLKNGSRLRKSESNFGLGSSKQDDDDDDDDGTGLIKRN